MTEIIKINPSRPSLKAVKRAVQIIRDGGLAIIPTDTVYGLVCDATNPEAVKRVFLVKKRSLTQPLSIAVGKYRHIYKYVNNIPSNARRLARKFLPGALTLIMEKSDAIPDIVTANQKTVGIRIPDCKVVLMLLEFLKRPIVIPSANLHNHPSSATAPAALRELTGKVNLVLDAGKTKHGKESTIVFCLGKKIEIIRHGAIPDYKIFKALSEY